MKPAPHCRVDGTLARPVGTMSEMLQRAIEPTAPPWSRDAWDRFMENLRQCPQRKRELAAALGIEEGDQ